MTSSRMLRALTSASRRYRHPARRGRSGQVVADCCASASRTLPAAKANPPTTARRSSAFLDRKTGRFQPLVRAIQRLFSEFTRFVDCLFGVTVALIPLVSVPSAGPMGVFLS